MTQAELLQVVYRFYPHEPWPSGFGVDEYDKNPEYERRRAATRAAALEYPRWKAMLGRLQQRYHVHDCSLHLFGDSADSAYSARLSPLHKPSDDDLDGVDRFRMRFGCKVSFLGPYYLVCRLGTPDEEPYAEDVAREIEATYVGYRPIPPELGKVLVPDVTVHNLGMGEATIHDCLLSTQWP